MDYELKGLWIDGCWCHVCFGSIQKKCGDEHKLLPKWFAGMFLRVLSLYTYGFYGCFKKIARAARACGAGEDGSQVPCPVLGVKLENPARFPGPVLHEINNYHINHHPPLRNCYQHILLPTLHRAENAVYKTAPSSSLHNT